MGPAGGIRNREQPVGEFTAVERACTINDLCVRSAAYGIPGMTVDGNDVLAVREAAGELIERARKGEGPSILECKTWRHHGHFEGDAADYKTPEQQEEWLGVKNPLPRFRSYLTEKAKVTLKEVEGIEAKVNTISSAVEFAKEQSRFSDPSSLLGRCLCSMTCGRRKAMEERSIWFSKQ